MAAVRSDGRPVPHKEHERTIQEYREKVLHGSGDRRQPTLQCALFRSELWIQTRSRVRPLASSSHHGLFLMERSDSLLEGATPAA